MPGPAEEQIQIDCASGPEDLRALAALARVIWTEHYTPIIGAAQVEYMLGRFQSEEAVARDIEENGTCYELVRVDGVPVGYAAFRAEPAAGEMFLSKIYLLRSYRGRGLARRMMDRVTAAASDAGCGWIRLTVNKHNTASIAVYEAMGFSIIDSVVTDIGGGFFMDDYILRRPAPMPSVGPEDINFRDPFVRVHDGRYYLYGTEGATCWQGDPGRLLVYTGTTLDRWEGPRVVFTPPPGFWADRNYWAPECHFYDGAFYLFVSFKSADRRRGTQILRSNNPDGPFKPVSDGPFTPADRECLDGTLHVDEDGRPWGVFCHEWVQIGNGTVCAVRLKPDLSGPADPDAEPLVLFSAKDAPWVSGIDKRDKAPGWPEPLGYVTDGPFLRTLPHGRLLMVWSSFSGNRRYTIGQAVSDHGIAGPWRQLPEPIYAEEGGHGMFFDTVDGRQMLAIHKPNQTLLERPVFLEIEETGDGFRVKR